MKTSIIGCGNIGNKLASYIDGKDCFELVSLTDLEPSRISALAANLKNNHPIPSTIEESIRNSELIIEAASPEAVTEILKFAGEPNHERKKLVVMSSGGLIDDIQRIKRLRNWNIYVPSGAIAGLDAIRAVAGSIDSLVLKTTKPCSGLRNAPYVAENGIMLDNLEEPKLIFEGSLTDAVSGFPQNINSAASLYLASGYEGLKVKIIADPHTRFNTHEITCTGSFGTITAKTENLPSENPRTSNLAIMSVLSVLEDLSNFSEPGGQTPGIRQAIKIGELI